MTRPRSRRARRAVTTHVVVLLVIAILCPITAAAPSAATGTGRAAEIRAAEIRRAPWRWPVAPPIRVLEPFRAPLTPYSEGHRGIDLAVRAGAEVAAAAPGVVRFAGRVADRPLVSIDHGDGVVSSIEPVEPSVGVGDVLERGSPIGRVAAGGHCADVCAHFGVRVDEEYVSPLLFLGGVPRAVLLPLSE